MADKGLFLINTGNGKGKSTAAFGLALRAAGQELRVAVIQFIKGKWQTGEIKAIEKHLTDSIDIFVTGTGFTWEQEIAAVKDAALAGWKLACDKITSDQYDLIVLDELTYLINMRFISEAEVLTVLTSRPNGQHVVITGRNASDGLIQAADLVTEMKEIKHPFHRGGSAVKGIEF
jgi:cob(I)alamin adenosyltransferase